MPSAFRYVYALHSPALCALKFGIAANIGDRLKQHRRMASDLRLVEYFERADPSDICSIERSIVERLSGRSIWVPGLRAVSREWFKDTDRAALNVLGNLTMEAKGVRPWSVMSPYLSAKPDYIQAALRL